MIRGIAHTLSFIALSLILAVAFQVLQLRRTVPDYSAQAELAGLKGPIKILRDDYAIPHIVAGDMTDAAFGLGYVHAEDRMWQMETSRRVVAGRMAEIGGKPALPIDTFIRTAGLYKAAAESFDALTEETQALLRAYTAGVNAAISARPREMGPEFVLLNLHPEPWTPQDSLAVFKMLAVGLSGNMMGEVANVRLLQQLTPQQISEFAPPYPGDGPILLPTLAELYPGIEITEPKKELASIESFEGPWEASNNWVVAGTQTATGKPLLANDPHLSFSAPSIWYLAHISLPDQNIVGGTMPGIPSILAGRTNDISWGLTNTGPDTQDLYLERINPDEPDQYQTPGGWADFETRTETIKVRFAADEQITIRSTRHGPVLPTSFVGDLFPENQYVLAVRWTALTPGDRSMDTQNAIPWVSNWQEFNEAFRHHVGPMQSVVYADRAGTIGLTAPAVVPVRGPDHETLGRLPAPGWKAENDWVGSIPFEEWPRYANPESGFIATANSKITPPGYKHFLTATWPEPLRTWQIENRLKEPGIRTVDEFEAMHLDNISLAAKSLLPFLLKTPANRESELKVLKTLEHWDGDMRPEGPEGLIYSVWVHNLGRVLYGDELGELYDRYSKPRPSFLVSVLKDGSSLTHWCDRQETEQVEDCTFVLGKALAKAADQLTEDYGPDFELERWGFHHRVIHAHQPFSLIPVIGRYFEIVTETGGGPYTPNQGMYRYTSSSPFQNRHGAGYRAVYDMNGEGGRFIQTTGQSGNPYSRHFDDMALLWQQGSLLPIVTDLVQLEKDASTISSFSPKAP